MALKQQVSNVYGVGLQNVGSYQVAGRPFITGSFLTGASPANKIPQVGTEPFTEIAVNFPTVTKSLTVWNYSADPASKLRITFASTGSMTNYPANGCYSELGWRDSITLTLKCKTVYLSAVSGDVLWKLYASLTNIPHERMYVLTGSGISE